MQYIEHYSVTNFRILFLCVFILTACHKEPGGTGLAIQAPFDLSRTYDHLADRSSLRIAFGSCLDQDKPAPIFAAIKRSSPDLFLMVGDNIYTEIKGNKFSSMHAAYRKLWARLAAVNLGVPIAAVWDDHDYGINDGGGDWIHKQEAERIFLDYWRVPADDLRRSRPGVYYEELIHLQNTVVQILYLDTRYFRTPLEPTDDRGAEGRQRYLPTSDPGATLLGAEQWKWLETKLAADFDYRVLVSSIQFAAVGHGWEAWKNIPGDRQRLIDLVDRESIENLVIASGDRHRGAMYELPTSSGSRIVEITSSPLNNARIRFEEPGPYRIGDSYTRANFGMVTIDALKNEITLELRDEDGEIVATVSAGG